MLKKALAITLALVMLLMPMTASAVTWNQLVTGLRNNGGTSYTSDDGETTITREIEDIGDGEKGTIIYVEGGRIVFDDAITAYDGENEYNHCFLKNITADYLNMHGADDQIVIVVLQGGSQVGEVHGTVRENQVGELANTDGSTVDVLHMDVFDGGIGAVVNHEGTVNTGLRGEAFNGGQVTIGNVEGYVADMSGYANEGSTIDMRNEKNSTVGTFHADVDNGSTAAVENFGTVENQMATGVYGEGSSAASVNHGTVMGELNMNVEHGAEGSHTNNGTAGSMYAYAGEGVVTAVNMGTVQGDMGADGYANGEALMQNYGTAGQMIGGSGEGGTVTAQNMENATTGEISVFSDDGGVVNATNDGTVEGRMIAASWGENGVASSVNNGTVEGQIRTTAGDGATGTSINAGTANGIRIQSSGGSEVLLENKEGGTAGNVELLGFDGQITAVNNGVIEYAIVDSFDGSQISFSGDGKVNDATVYINAPSTDTYTASQLAELLKAINIPNATTELWTLDEDGNYIAAYQITEDGELVLIEVFEEEEEEPYVEPDPVEVQRQLEGIGGVTTSPVWNWQGYLGHSSKPMWIYVSGEKTLMRQQLFWLGDSTKNHTCRINASEPDPASIELRVGLDMLRTAKRAEISMISILDKESNPIAQFAVSDLMAAFEQYGLVEGELLCVSANPDAEVMKITLAGEYLPLEEKAE